MSFAPTIAPKVAADPSTGEVVRVYDGKLARNLIFAAQMQLEAEGNGLHAWINQSKQNMSDYYTKIFTKTIVKQVEVDDRRTVVDLLNALDTEDEARRVMANDPKPIEASFTEFAPVKVGIDDEADDE